MWCKRGVLSSSCSVEFKFTRAEVNAVSQTEMCDKRLNKNDTKESLQKEISHGRRAFYQRHKAHRHRLGSTLKGGLKPTLELSLAQPSFYPHITGRFCRARLPPSRIGQ